jgi:hypothetical protein
MSVPVTGALFGACAALVACAPVVLAGYLITLFGRSWRSARDVIRQTQDEYPPDVEADIAAALAIDCPLCGLSEGSHQ